MSPTNSPVHSPCGSSPTQPGMSPVKSPVTSLPPLHGSLTLNVAKRRKVDDALSPRDSRRAVSGSLGATAGTPGASLGAQPSLVTPSKRSVSTPVRLLTPRGGRRTPSLADRPIPVLMPQDEEPEEEATRSRRASYASLYQMDTDKEEEDKEDKEEVTGQTETQLSESKHTLSIETTKGKEVDEEVDEADEAAEVDSPEASVSPVESSSSVIEVVATSTESLVNEAVGHVPAHSVLPPPSQMEPPSSPRKR